MARGFSFLRDWSPFILLLWFLRRLCAMRLEPHLAVHGQFSGFSGPQLFKVAADALKELCRKNEVPLAV